MRNTTLLLIASLVSGHMFGQAAEKAPPPAATSATVLHASTQLVVVDVVVEDRSGNPVRGLRHEDFRITENKAPQIVRNFEAHTSNDTGQLPPIPPMPPGTFTDYTPVKPNAPLNIILLDSLNTQPMDQIYVRQQFGDYVKHADPKAQIAIFGLGTKLTLLQGFTSNPAVLRAAVEHRLLSRTSPLLQQAGDTNASDGMSSLATNAAEAGALAETIANMKQFEAEHAAFQTELRIKYTLDAFRQIAVFVRVSRS